MFLFWLILTVGSAYGITYLVGPYVSEARLKLAQNEGDFFMEKLRLVHFAEVGKFPLRFVPMPVKNLWEKWWGQTFVPFILKEFEKITSRLRLVVLKIERKLHSLTNYIRGKRESGMNGSETKSAYWEEIKKAEDGHK